MELERDCRYCGQIVLFTDERRTKTGKRIPLDCETREIHECIGAKEAFAEIKNYKRSIEQIPGQLNDERIVMDTIARVMDANRLLRTCQLRVVREDKAF